jgi:histidyl-tRNA synthetase
MYTFTDKGGDRVTLRPEATPSMVRAYVEHNLEQALASVKLYTCGPMFRYGRPQKGRYRQFHQLDVEVFGLTDPAIDAEVIDLAWSLINKLRIHRAELVINSVAGSPPRFRKRCSRLGG